MSHFHNHNPAPAHQRPLFIINNNLQLNRCKVDASSINREQAKHAIFTLLHDYLKLGVRIRDCAIIDSQFNSVFVCNYVDTADMLRNSYRRYPNKPAAKTTQRALL